MRCDGGLRVRFATVGMRELAEHLFTRGGEIAIEAPDAPVAVMRERLSEAMTIVQPERTTEAGVAPPMDRS